MVRTYQHPCNRLQMPLVHVPCQGFPTVLPTARFVVVPSITVMANYYYYYYYHHHHHLLLLLLLLPLTLALQPTVGFGLSNNVLPFFPICHQLSPSSHSHHLKISFSFHLFQGLPLLLVPSSSWVKIFLGILSFSIISRRPNPLILCPFIHFAIFSPLLISSSSRFVQLFHFPFKYLGLYILLNEYYIYVRLKWKLPCY